MLYYQDENISIRSISEGDITYLFQWQIDKEVNQYDPRPLPSNVDELLKECENFCNVFKTQIMNEKKELNKYMYFIIENHNNQPIGFINFFNIDTSKKQGEAGIIIGDKRYWNKGIGCLAFDKVAEYIFANMDINRIYIETGESNIPALKLFTKLSFKKCGEFTEEDGFKFIQMEKLKNGL